MIGTLLLARNAVLRRERNKFRIQQMEREAERNEEVNQMKFRFFTNVSHELRTPLTLIISPLEGMMKETHDERKQEQLKLMHRNALRLLNLVNQLLDFRKAENKGFKLNPKEYNIGTIVHSVYKYFTTFGKAKGN